MSGKIGEDRDQAFGSGAQLKENHAAKRKAAYEVLAERAGAFEVFRMQSDARPGWADVLTPEQIADFGINDNFEPISQEQYAALLVKMRSEPQSEADGAA